MWRSTGFSRMVVCCFVAGSAIATMGCGSKHANRSIVRATIGERDVKASVDGDAFIAPREDSAIISFGGGKKFVVEKTSIQLDGKEIAKVPETAKNVAVDYTAGKLTITADGQTVLDTQFTK